MPRYDDASTDSARRGELLMLQRGELRQAHDPLTIYSVSFLRRPEHLRSWLADVAYILMIVVGCALVAFVVLAASFIFAIEYASR
jgi:hypothetical protein